MITPTAFFPFCAPIFYLPVDEKPQKTIHNHLAITSVIEEYLRENYDYWILDIPASSKDVRSYLWKGASVEPRYSYVVSLKKRDEIFNNFNQSIRKKLKQAENQEMVVTESRDFNLLVELINTSYRRHGMRPLVPEGQLMNFISEIISLEEVKLFYLDIDGKIIVFPLIILRQQFLAKCIRHDLIDLYACFISNVSNIFQQSRNIIA